MTWFSLGALAVLLLLALPSDRTSSQRNSTIPAAGNTTTSTRSGTASGNQAELMSRNQLNLWSDVQNCYGDYSCMTVISTTSTTVDNTSTSIDTTTRTDVSGNGNTITSPINGALLCWDAALNTYTSSACGQQGGTP
jgi:hypothetical protein